MLLSPSPERPRTFPTLHSLEPPVLLSLRLSLGCPPPTGLGGPLPHPPRPLRQPGQGPSEDLLGEGLAKVLWVLVCPPNPVLTCFTRNQGATGEVAVADVARVDSGVGRAAL